MTTSAKAEGRLLFLPVRVCSQAGSLSAKSPHLDDHQRKG
jgi:hypothetical protein